MAKILFSMAGEGRGHATRVRAMVDLLRGRHQISLFAPGDAFDLLAPAFAGTEVPVEQIPGLRFYYSPKGRLDPFRTLGMAGKYLVGFPRLLWDLRARIQEEKPDLVITDFEPSLPRAARRLGVPFISLNHQHFLVVNDLTALPKHLQRYAKLFSLVVRGYYSGMERTIVSSFYFPPLLPAFRNKVVQVGVILRPAVIATPSTRAGHLVAYLRKFGPPHVIEALKKVRMPVKLYGLGVRPRDANIEFKAISESEFLKDLGSCEALVSTAGNQLVGEALYLGKPVLAMPEPNNHEQYINAFFLAQERTGDWCELDAFSGEVLQGFLDRLDEYRSRIAPERYNGTPLAQKTIEDFLAHRGHQ